MQHFDIPSEQIIAWRRHLHQHPELSFKEVQTSQYIVDELTKIGGLDIQRPTPTSVVAVLKGARGEGQCIALRADIYALPVEEQNEVDFRSVNAGVSHVCGHDAHAAILLGTAKVLASLKDRLAGTVKFVFQPAEEVPPGGAVALIEAGVFKDVDACFGLHVVNDKAGLVRIIETEAATTSCDACTIKIQGRGSHGSMPQFAIDPLLTGAEMVLAINTIVSRNVSPDNFAVVSPTVFNCGSVVNVIPHTAELGINTRVKNEQDRELVMKRINEIAESVAKANGATIEINWSKGYGAVIQDLGLVALARETAIETMGEENVASSKGLTASEDFSAYSNVTKCCYFTVGSGNADEGYPFMNHHPKLNIDEKCLTVGTKMEVAIVMKLLGDQ